MTIHDSQQAHPGDLANGSAARHAADGDADPAEGREGRPFEETEASRTTEGSSEGDYPPPHSEGDPGGPADPEEARGRPFEPTEPSQSKKGTAEGDYPPPGHRE